MLAIIQVLKIATYVSYLPHCQTKYVIFPTLQTILVDSLHPEKSSLGCTKKQRVLLNIFHDILISCILTTEIFINRSMYWESLVTPEGEKKQTVLQYLMC
jgi:hypothetical protein